MQLCGLALGPYGGVRFRSSRKFVILYKSREMSQTFKEVIFMSWKSEDGILHVGRLVDEYTT